MDSDNTEPFDISKTLLFKNATETEEEVLKHKWIESEKAGRDVGYEFARLDWMVRCRGKRGEGQPLTPTDPSNT
jgi:hypothetical protein